MIALALTGGCARQPLHVHLDASAVGQSEFLIEALTAEPPAREALWQQAQRDRSGDVAVLRHALLRSVPGHSGYDIAAAESELQAFVGAEPSASLALIARARLEDLRAARQSRAELDQLKRRLSKVADIERRQDQNRR